MNKKYIKILRNLVPNNNSKIVLNKSVCDALAAVQSLRVITDGSFSDVVHNNWYVGEKEYEYLIKEHLFKYMRNILSLRLHYIISEQLVYSKLGLSDDFQGFQASTHEKRICKLPDEIGDLSELITLDLSNTNIQELPSTIANLSKLEYLFINNTKVSDIPSWIGSYSKLQELSLESLKIQRIPKEIMNLGLPFKEVYRYHLWEKGIFINNTKIALQPVSLFYQSNELIQKYFDSEKIELKESKVIFMGDGGAGKSYTIQRIMNNGVRLVTDTDVTHDITIEHWENSDHVVDYDGTIDFWDFGGQDIYLSMHKCFLTERSCYVIVLCNRQYGSHRGLMRQVRYWLKNIAASAKNSPILIAINTWSGQPRDGISLTQLRKEFPELNIIDQIVYNAKDDMAEEFNRLIGRICQMAKGNCSYDLQFPISWRNIRNRLRQEYRSNNLISETDFYKICEEEMSSIDHYYDRDIATWLLSWFNDLGDCFNYHDVFNNKKDTEYYVLRPQWVIRAMYKIINFSINLDVSSIESLKIEDLSEELSENSIYPDGQIPKKVIVKLLEIGEEYKGRVEYIIQILEKNGLAYSLGSGIKENVFIPSICSDIRPDDFDEPDYDFNTSTMYLVRFIYLPETVIHRLMIKCYQKGKGLNRVWRFGFWLEDDEECLVVEMIADNEIKISYYRNKTDNDCLGLHRMIKWLAEIYKELGIENTREFIVIMRPNQTALISIKALISAFKENPKIELFYVQDDDIYKGYRVNDLLSGLFGNAYRQLLLGKSAEKSETRLDMKQVNPEHYSEVIVQKDEIKTIISLLHEINEKKEPVDSEIIEVAAQRIISAMKEIHIDNIEEKIHEQELMKDILTRGEDGDEKKLSQFLSNGNSIAGLLSFFVKLGKYGATYL